MSTSEPLRTSDPHIHRGHRNGYRQRSWATMVGHCGAGGAPGEGWQLLTVLVEAQRLIWDRQVLVHAPLREIPNLAVGGPLRFVARFLGVG